MNKILVWPLSQEYKIIFASTSASLSTMTCCNHLTVYLQNEEPLLVILSDLYGRDLMLLKDSLQQLVLKAGKIKFLNCLYVIGDQTDEFMLEIHHPSGLIYTQQIFKDMLNSWIAQLDLLQILMEENELEKKSRSKGGCC